MTDTILRVTHEQNAADPTVALLWQYQNATALASLIQSKQAWYEAHDNSFWYQWAFEVFYLDNCNEFGASVWAIILNLPINIVQPSTSGDTFGYGSGNFNFNNAPFNPSSSSTVNVTLDQARLALKLRCFQLFYRATIPNINRFMYYLLDTANTGNRCWVVDNLNMTLTYKFNFQPTADQEYVFDAFDLLPRPAGVKIDRAVEIGDVFGYGLGNLNFNNAPFFGG